MEKIYKDQAKNKEQRKAKNKAFELLADTLSTKYGFNDVRKLGVRLEGACAQIEIHAQKTIDIKSRRKPIQSLHTKIDGLQKSISNLGQREHNYLNSFIEIYDNDVGDLHAILGRLESDLVDLRLASEVGLIDMKNSEGTRPKSKAWEVVSSLANTWLEEKGEQPTCWKIRGSEYNNYAGEFYNFMADFYSQVGITPIPSGRTVTSVLSQWRNAKSGKK
ncbi:MAG: hypothetical protein COB23_07190 [Methylophaga sp.]|nr:MAG: hypothetical protein COB23_07190 [Methylophaga sp.]